MTPTRLRRFFAAASPWRIIRWIAAAAVYAATLAIAVDQVRTKSAALEDAERQLAEIRKSSAVIGHGLQNMAELNRESMELTEKLKAGLIAEQERQKAEAISKLEGLMEKVKESARLQAQVDAVRPTPAAPVTPRPVAPVVVKQASEPELPWWKPRLRSKVDAAIRADAQNHWKKDFTMVEYQIRTETEAYDKLLDYNKDWRPETHGIIARAIKEYGSDWSLVVYEVEKQIAAKARLGVR